MRLKITHFFSILFITAIVSFIPINAYDIFDSYEMFNGHGPDIEMDREGNLHLVWADGRNVRYLFGQRMADGKFDFWPVNESIEVPGSSSASSFRYGYPKIAADIDGGLHIAWINSNLNEMFYAHYDHGDWLYHGKVKSTYPRYIGNCDIEVDTQKRVYLSYQNPKLGPPYGTGVMCFRHDQGVIWDRMMIPMDSGEEKYPSLAHNSYEPIGPTNPLYVFWKEIHHFAVYNGSDWSPAMQVPGIPQYNGRVDMDIDPQNKPVLCYLKWITGAEWWIEGIYVQTCNDYGYDWNDGMKVSTSGQVIFREDYSPVAPEIGINGSGDMVCTWDDNGVLKYNVYENNRWLDEEKTIGYVNMHVCNGNASTQYGDIIVIHENQGNRMFFNHFRFNQAPTILLGAANTHSFEMEGFEIGGDLNITAIIQDANGQDDIQTVHVLDYESLQPIFNLYDDGEHGDLGPNDTIYGSDLPDDYYLPGERQMFYIQAIDKNGASSDLYPYLIIHGSSQTSNGYKDPQIFGIDHGDITTMAAGDGDYFICLGGYMNSNLMDGSDCWLDIMAWVLPKSGNVNSTVDRVELMYENKPVLELPKVLSADEWGDFYGFSIPLPGDSLSGLGGSLLLFQIRAVDSNGQAGPVWPYLDIPQAPPTATPTVVPTNTPKPTMPPFPTNTPRPTMPPLPTNTPSPEPTETPSPEPTSTDTPEPTETPSPEPTSTDTPEPTVTPVPSDTPTIIPPIGAN